MRLLEMSPIEHAQMEMWFSDAQWEEHKKLLWHLNYLPYLTKPIPGVEVKVKRRDYFVTYGHVMVTQWFTLSPFLKQDHPEFYQKIADNCIAMIKVPTEHGNFVLAIPKIADTAVTKLDTLTQGTSFHLSAAWIPPFGIFNLTSQVRPLIVGSDDPATFCGYIRKHKFRGFKLEPIDRKVQWNNLPIVPEPTDFYYRIEP